MISLTKFFNPEDDIKVMKCTEDLEKYLKKNNQSLENTYWSPKIDGVRTWIVSDSLTSIKYYSRNKKEFLNFLLKN